ncbi:MAG: hypothetical protein GW823_06590 [Bacteroidetes bacterium]|nr:hypothetical protein [Bacteroidota bacterium]
MTFNFLETLLVALIGALIGQLIVYFFTKYNTFLDLKLKKKLVIDDLKTQIQLLDYNQKKHVELKDQFLQRDLNSFTTSIFQTLHLDIYNSLSKSDLYKIFKQKLPIIVDIYKSIEFIKQYGPYKIYETYLIDSERHLKSKEHDSTHDFYCQVHKQFIEIAIRNIDNNINTIDEIKKNTEIIFHKKK